MLNCGHELNFMKVIVGKCLRNVSFIVFNVFFVVVENKLAFILFS